MAVYPARQVIPVPLNPTRTAGPLRRDRRMVVRDTTIRRSRSGITGRVGAVAHTTRAAVNTDSRRPILPVPRDAGTLPLESPGVAEPYRDAHNPGGILNGVPTVSGGDAMNVERLRRVVEVLRGVPDAAFAMETWWRANCKTVGCAVGHYIAATPDCGLELRRCDTYWRVLPAGGDPEGCGDWDSVEEHFGLSSADAFYLFDSDSYGDGLSYPTRLEVLVRIEDFIASRRTVPEPSTVQS